MGLMKQVDVNQFFGKQEDDQYWLSFVKIRE